MKHVRWLIPLAVLVVLAVTNPPMSAYAVWAVHTIETHASGLVSTLSTLFAGSIENAVASSTTRDNYLIFSVYHTTAFGRRFTVLGIVNHFVLLSHH